MPFHMTIEKPAPLSDRAEQIMVPMRDGVRLATDVYLPDKVGRGPAVLVRLPYDKCGRYTFMPQIGEAFTERGYVFVVQDVRGKFRSDGETMPFAHEVEDGYDTLDWLVTQSWSNGAVGMWGDSYYGFTQWAAIASGHPAVRAIVPRVTSAEGLGLDYWGDSCVQLYGAEYLACFWTDNLVYFFPTDFDHRPLATMFDEAFAGIGRRSQGFDRLMVGQGPGGYPLYAGHGHPFDRLRVPVLHSTGWFDNVMPQSMRDYVALRRRTGVASLQYLHADATDHENYHLSHYPVQQEADHAENDAAMARLIPEIVGPGLDFFDAFLAGMRDPSGIPQARWHLGHVGWREDPGWPPPQARELRLYLTGAARAARDAEGGELAAAPAGSRETARWEHDPERLVPSTPGDPFALVRCWPDEREIESRGDVLTFTSEPFAEPLDLAGPVVAGLVPSSSGPSMHLFAKLLDVSPDGAARMLNRGQKHVPAPAFGRLAEIDLGHNGYRVQPGHRLRLHVASSDFPQYLPHFGTDESPWLATGGAVNVQELATGGSDGSYVGLTVLPAR